MTEEEWLAVSPLAAARAKRAAKAAHGHVKAPQAPVAAAAAAAEAHQAVEARAETARIVEAVNAAAAAHQDADESPAKPPMELRRVYEWNPEQRRYVDVLRAFPPKMDRKEARAAREAAKAARAEAKAERAAKIAAYPGLPRVPAHPNDVKDLNREVRVETGDHQTAAGPGRHRPGQDPWHAKSSTRMRCHDDAHGSGQNKMRDGRAYARR